MVVPLINSQVPASGIVSVFLFNGSWLQAMNSSASNIWKISFFIRIKVANLCSITTQIITFVTYLPYETQSSIPQLWYCMLISPLYICIADFLLDLAVFRQGNPASVNKARIDFTGRGFFNGGTQNSGADLAEAFDVEGNVQHFGARRICYQTGRIAHRRKYRP